MRDGYDLGGRVAIVTGGSEGIGKATATLMAKYGADVVIVGRTAETLAMSVAEIETASGRRCMGVQADVCDPDQISALTARTLDSLGHIDILVNNVGWSDIEPIASLELNEWRSEFGLNLDASFLCSRAVFPHMQAHGGGAIVNTSSVAGIDGFKGRAAYSAAKSALQMFTRVAAAEWGIFGIRVNAVAPGLILTKNALLQFEALGMDVTKICRRRALGRPGTPHDVANAIVFLASDAASYISGETLQVAGGPDLS